MRGFILLMARSECNRTHYKLNINLKPILGKKVRTLRIFNNHSAKTKAVVTRGNFNR